VASQGLRYMELGSGCVNRASQKRQELATIGVTGGVEEAS
jgi:hypothetical protein